MEEKKEGQFKIEQLMEKTNYVKINLSHYLPALMEYTSDLNIDWDGIDKRFREEYERRKAELKRINRETMQVEATVYDIIVEARKYNPHAISYLHFLNSVFNKLSDIINPKERKLIKKNIEDFLNQMDKNYLNYLGEIAVLHNLLSKGEYKLEGVEMKLPNGCHIDFKLKKVDDGSIVLVEIDNIHAKSEKIEKVDEKIKAFFNYRYNQKLSEKNKGLTEAVAFEVVHVIWTFISKDLEVYSDYFKRNKNQTENTNEPVAYLPLANDVRFENRFGRVSNLFNNDNENWKNQISEEA